MGFCHKCCCTRENSRSTGGVIHTDREKEQGRREGGGRVQRSFGAVGTLWRGTDSFLLHKCFPATKKHIYLFIWQEKKTYLR